MPTDLQCCDQTQEHNSHRGKGLTRLRLVRMLTTHQKIVSPQQPSSHHITMRSGLHGCYLNRPVAAPVAWVTKGDAVSASRREQQQQHWLGRMTFKDVFDACMSSVSSAFLQLNHQDKERLCLGCWIQTVMRQWIQRHERNPQHCGGGTADRCCLSKSVHEST